MYTAKEVLKQDPKQYKMYFVIGQILLINGNKEEAIQYFIKTLNIAPDFIIAQEYLTKARQMK